MILTIDFLSICIWILVLVQLTSCDMTEGSSEAACTAAGECSSCSPPRPARPYFRTALARSVYSKILQDNEFEKFNRSKVRPPLPAPAACEKPQRQAPPDVNRPARLCEAPKWWNPWWHRGGASRHALTGSHTILAVGSNYTWTQQLPTHYDWFL